eukprot:GHVN01063097.1.p1 GENE.GHVN01063097.1~~GHVN01063097.1.p1  ORF type:complete len:273 (+),score=23.62 GHVN01063097.1:55-819(+)
MLDSEKSKREELTEKVEMYKTIIFGVLGQFVSIERLQIVVGSDFQQSPEYIMNVYELCSKTSLNAALRAGSEVVKQCDTKMLSSLLYPVLQVVDEIALNVDAQFGGVDQRKVFTYAQDYLPRIGKPKQIHLVSRMINSITGGKMSSSSNNKISFFDAETEIRSKVLKAYCPQKVKENNWALEFCESVIFEVVHRLNKPFVIPRKNKESLSFDEYAILETAFMDGLLHPEDLKIAIAQILWEICQHIPRPSKSSA